MFKEIVTAFDGSEHSELAVKAACSVAEKYDANLHIVHVPEVYDEAVTMGASGMGAAGVVLPVRVETFQESGKSMIARATELAEKAGRPPVSKEILAAPAADAIISFAEKKNADLIVSGRRGLGNLKGIILGSVSQQLASSADCAVLTVK